MEALVPSRRRSVIPAKYDKETIERVLRMYSERRVEVPEGSQAASANQALALTRVPAETIYAGEGVGLWDSTWTWTPSPCAERGWAPGAAEFGCSGGIPIMWTFARY